VSEQPIPFPLPDNPASTIQAPSADVNQPGAMPTAVRAGLEINELSAVAGIISPDIINLDRGVVQNPQPLSGPVEQ
jgi:hypothetical protein